MKPSHFSSRFSAALISALCLLCSGGLLAENLYDEQTYRPLASDKRAHLPGDVITIMIYENSSARTSADTAVQRNSGVGLQAGADNHQHQGSLGANATFDGGGTIQRSGALLAQITATVTKVASNGDLWISGQQVVAINSDRQEIKVEGRVRVLDISDSNTVPSNRIADAKISYLGDGDLAAHQKPGWLSRFFTMVGL
ncbi:MAG: flagellar basal body L-ring protein FlgH [Burkholderiales bacterium]|nr:flagellar basal body L-ring protein FlgH [Burkholderiales bacterium]